MNRFTSMKTSFSRELTACAAATLLIGAAACGDQADPTYEGQALAVMQGTIDRDPALVVSDAEVSLAWKEGPNDSTNTHTRFVAEQVRVRGDFPANFTLTLRQPPPKSAIVTEADARYAAAAVVVGKPGALKGTVDVRQLERGALYGALAEPFVAYIAEDIAADSTFGALAGGPVKKGFYFGRSIELDPSEAERRHAHCQRVTKDPALAEKYCPEGEARGRFPSFTSISDPIRITLAPNAVFPFVPDEEPTDEPDDGERPAGKR
jgi:hypothetical protein